MATNSRCDAFHIEIVHGETTLPQSAPPDSRLTFVSVIANPETLEAGCLPLEVWLPELAPSDELRVRYDSGGVNFHEFSREYSVELEQHFEQCERLRTAACDTGLALVIKNDDKEHRSMAIAMQQHLGRLECKRRWDAGLIIGGYVYPLRDEIEQAGGLWNARHLAWMMPDRETWKYIQSLLPGDF